MVKIVKNTLKKFLLTCLIFVLAIAWVFSGRPRIWQEPPIPPGIQEARAASTPVVQSFSTATTEGATDGELIFTAPSGLAANDLILILVMNDNSNSQTWPAITTPDAYTQIVHANNSADVQGSIYWRIAAGSETWPLTIDGGLNHAVGWALRISGVNTSNPINQEGAWAGVGSTGANLTIAEVTTNVDNALGIFLVGTDGSDLTPSTITSGGPAWSITDGLEDPSDNASGVGADWGQKDITGAGGSSNIVLDFYGTGSDGRVGIQIAIAPNPNASPVAPTIYDEPEATGSGSTFDNERLQDTTPTFEFSANDPDGSSNIRYKVQWDDDGGFNTLNGNCESGSSCATGNGTFSGSDPYAEDAHANFTIGDTLSEITYYWRVQAQDVTGSGQYGEWSTRSFTVKSGTDPSEWFQTEDEQFDTGKLIDVETTGSDSVRIESGISGDNWGDTTGEGTVSAQSTARYMGGTSPDVNGMVIKEIWAYYGGTGTIRLAVYQGGALDNPVGASLVWDAGTVAVSGTGWYSISGGSASLDPNEVTWIGYKSTDASYVYDTSWDSGSDFQSARGRWESTAESGDSSVTWGSSIPSGGSFGSYWYDVYIIYDVIGASGTIMSPEIDFDWVSGATGWDKVQLSKNEANGMVSVRVLGSNTSDCDTQVIAPTSASQIDLSGLTSTSEGQLHNRLCLEATLTDSGGTPYLEDWTVSWSSGGIISCSISATSTSFGLLAADAVSTSTPNINISMSCASTASGCTLSVQGTGSSTEPGLWNSAASHLIASADTTLSAGTEGYGIQATSTDTGWALNPKYLATGDQVGGLTIAIITLASSTADIATSTATITHKAARSASTPTGSYQDTITYSCIPN